MNKAIHISLPWLLLLILCISIVVTGLILATSDPRQSRSTPTATKTPTSTEATTSEAADLTETRPYSATSEAADLTETRPYASTSPWNTPIGPNPKYDPHSAEMVATIKRGSDGRITSDPSQYSYPVYFVDESTPRWNIPCLKHSCTVITTEGVSITEQLKDVPIPPEAQPSKGSDAQMIIIDKVTGAEYDLWQVKRTETGWTVSNGSVYNIFWDAMPPRRGSRGAGVPYYAGLIRPWEIIQGRIDHAIAFGYPNAAKERCVFPAAKTDGMSSMPYAIPEGARLQLDPALTDADFDRMGLDRTGKIIARALQEYGMILIDVAGRPKIYAENLVDNPYTMVQWSDPELNLTDTTIADIPHTFFRVIALPEAYWNATLDGPRHGDCYAYPEASPAPRPTSQSSFPPTYSTPSRTVTAQPEFEVEGQARNDDVPPSTHFAPFGAVIVEPDFEVSGQGKNVDTIAFWEAPNPHDTLMFVTAKNNQMVEVWKYPFVDNEESPLEHNSFGSSSQVNGVVVDQENDLLYVSVSKPASTVSVFSVPQLEFQQEFIEGSKNLKSEPNITLLKQPDGKAWAYVSADDIVYIYDPYTGAEAGQYKPATGVETLVADNFYQVIYIPDENGRTGVYAYHPDGTQYIRNSANKLGSEVFQSDAEGILLYSCLSQRGSDNGSGFIVVADQKKDETDFEFFSRQTWEHLGTVQINGVSNTDGIASTQRPLPKYSSGIFAAINDDTNTVGVGWDKIFDATGLHCEQEES